MKKALYVCWIYVLLHSVVDAQMPQHTRSCGMQELQESMIAADPSSERRLADQKASLQFVADQYIVYKKHAGSQRTTAVAAVPVIFHVIVDSAQFKALGGTTGIAQRCDSQIVVLNRDFNKQNYDSVHIPSGWTSLYGDAGIQFGLARIDPDGHCATGFEVMIIAGNTLADAGFNDSYDAFKQAKVAGTGLVSWDVDKYYNVWCVNINGVAAYYLGNVVPRSYAVGGSGLTLDDVGVVLQYNTLGSTGPTNVPPVGTGDTSGWLVPFNLGRPLTHMTGHFFEIWHTWGDDGGACPWAPVATSCTVTGSGDDGLSDTPPESNITTGNPAYTIPGGTINDCCMLYGTIDTQLIGIPCLNYMDGTDDAAMHLFTPMQAAAMAAMVLEPPIADSTSITGGTIGESHSLTQHPELLGSPCLNAGITSIAAKNDVRIYPNPANDKITIFVNAINETLNEIVVTDLLARHVITINGSGKDYYSIDLSGMSKGIYFVKCNFASGSVTRKILLQ